MFYTPVSFVSFVFYFVFQVANNKFLKVLFNKFSLGNKTEGCGHDYVEINGERSVTSRVMPFKERLFLVYSAVKRSYITTNVNIFSLKNGK